VRAEELGKKNQVGQLGWDDRFLDLAAFIASWSKDPSTKCGAVLTKGNRVVSVGYNGFPRGVDDNIELLESRDKKYPRIIHAEMNALMFARGRTKGCTLYTWPFQPCAPCAGPIIQADVIRVVSPLHHVEAAERWNESFKLAADMFGQSRVVLLLKVETEEQEMRRAQR